MEHLFSAHASLIIIFLLNKTRSSHSESKFSRDHCLYQSHVLRISRHKSLAPAHDNDSTIILVPTKRPFWKDLFRKSLRSVWPF